MKTLLVGLLSVVSVTAFAQQASHRDFDPRDLPGTPVPAILYPYENPATVGYPHVSDSTGPSMWSIPSGQPYYTPLLDATQKRTWLWPENSVLPTTDSLTIITVDSLQNLVIHRQKQETPKH